jgi:hypothetical protein
MVGAVDDDSWALQTGGGWTQAPPSYTGYQNVAGTDNSFDLAYKIQAATGSTGDIVFRQTNRGGDAGSYYTVSFK